VKAKTSRKPTRKTAKKTPDLLPRRSASVKGGDEVSAVQKKIAAERDAAAMQFGAAAVAAAATFGMGAAGTGGGAGAAAGSASSTVTKTHKG
jgi:hypothetical protein